VTDSSIVYVLTKTFGRWSAGTKFTVVELNEESKIAECLTFYRYLHPLGAKNYREHIPMELLVAVRNR
jgi:hypothetical protein